MSGSVKVVVAFCVSMALGCGGGSGVRSPPAGNGGAGGSGAPTGAGGDTGGAGGGTGGAGGAAAGGSGGGNPDGSVPALTHQTTGQSWTFLVYMAADNNLETAALLDLQEMAEVGSTSQTHIVVQIDRSAGYVQSPVVDLPDFSGAKRLLVHNSSLEVLQNLGSVDSGSGDTLAQFITWGISHYPADRTALILWDHGGGWNGYGVDETAGSLITAPALRTAIAQGLAGAQLPRLALVGFDACLMATFEIASMLKPYAEYLLASEEIIPGHGLDYVALSAATVDPTIAPPALARRLMDGYVAQSMTYGDDATITMSLTDLYALGDLQAALGDLAGASGTPLSTVKATTIGRTRGVAREFGDQGQTPGVMVDVVDLAADLGAADPAYATASTEIAAAVRKAVLLEHHGPSRAGSNGLSVYFPFQLRDEDPAFEQIMDVAAWRGFLDAYLGVANGGPVGAPAFSNPGGVADAQIVGGQLVVSGTLTPGSSASISSATLYYGIYDTTSGSLFVLGSTPADYDSTTVQGSWDLGILRLDQGTASAYGYLSAEVAQDGSVSLTIPFVYDQSAGATDQNAFRVLVFDAALTLVQDGYYLDSSGVFGPLTAAVGSTLSATILVTDQSGLTQWIKTNVAFDAMQPIAPSIESLPTGTVVFGELVIQNIREESSFVVATLSI